MAEKKVAKPKVEKDEPVVSTTSVATPSAKKPTSVGVFDGSKLVRVYSAEMHGEDYRKLAEQFVSHPDRKAFTVADYTPPPMPKPEDEDADKVSILAPSGDVVRVFSLKENGKDYREMAQAIVEKYPKRQYTLK